MHPLKYTSEQIAEMLDRTNWSDGFSWEQMKRLSQFFKVYGAAQGQVLFEQGATDNSMGILLKGTLHVVREADGKRNQLATVRAPQTFGELSLLDGQPRSAHIIAVSEVEYLLITQIGLDKLSADYPLVGYRVLWKIAYILSQRLRSTSGVLAEYLEVH